MFHTKELHISDATFKDNIKTSDYHFNALRQRPVYPATFIDINYTQLKPFPDKWKSFNEANNVSDRVSRPHLSKRCLFYDVDTGQHVHMSSLDTIGAQHLLDAELKFPQNDYVLETLGYKRRVYDKRNGLSETSPGDKPYKTVEYSSKFFDKANRNWRSETHALNKSSCSDEISEEDLLKFKRLLHLDPSDSLFKYHKDLSYEHDKQKEHLDDIERVRNLDEWKPAPKLETPFKVLDIENKNHKYRPKVIK